MVRAHLARQSVKHRFAGQTAWLNVQDAVFNRKARPMAELLRTTDIVLLTYVNSLLSDAGIPSMVADMHVSVIEGSIGAFPRRVLIAAEDWDESVAILTEAGLAAHLAAPAHERAGKSL